MTCPHCDDPHPHVHRDGRGIEPPGDPRLLIVLIGLVLAGFGIAYVLIVSAIQGWL